LVLVVLFLTDSFFVVDGFLILAGFDSFAYEGDFFEECWLYTATSTGISS
jgi:hypothetical protein